MGAYAGSLKIKNVSGSSYSVEEINGVAISDQDELDLVTSGYTYRDAERLVEKCPAAKLYIDIKAGLLQVTTKDTPRYVSVP